MTHPLNICAFSRVNYWQGIKGGMDFHGKMLSEGLVRQGNRVTMISSKHSQAILYDKKNGVDIHYLPDTVFGSRRHGWGSKSVRRFQTLHGQTPYDLIWSQSFDAFGFARVKASIQRPPIIATLHGSISQEWKSFLSNAPQDLKNPKQIIVRIAGLFFAYFLCQRPLLTIADRVICVSPKVAEDIGKWFGNRYKAKCIVVENGIDVDNFRPDPEKGNQVRQLHGINPDETLILSLGRLSHEKGHHVAIQALKNLLDRRINVRLIIAGQGEYLEALKKSVQKLNLIDHVIFTGFLPHDEAVAYYNAADIFVMPTMTIEGLPFVLLEAMACGKPVIASRIGGNVSVVSHGINGLLVEPGNYIDLAEEIVELRNNSKLRDALSQAARATVVKRYSVERMVMETLSVMKSAIQAGHQSYLSTRESS